MFAVMLLHLEVCAANFYFQPGRGLELSWTTDDRFGVTTGNISYGEMEQLAWRASSTASSDRTYRSIYATGYQLNTNTAYYSYYPYQWVKTFDARNIQCRYDQQSQNGNGSAASISLCDYSMAGAMTSDNAALFDFHRIGGVLRISFPSPEAMTIASLTLNADAPVLATSATMNLIGWYALPGSYSASLTMQTQNITVAKGTEVVLYVALPAQDLSANALDIQVTASSGTTYSIARVIGPNVKASRLYDMALNAPSVVSASKPLFRQTVGQPVLTAAGIANPLVRGSDILLDSDYRVQYAPKGTKGDVNADGEIDVLDAVALTGYYSRGRTAELDRTICDMNGDGDIDVLDVIEIISRYVKKQE